jgi:DNA-binding transcriptional regulator GbsR (MarR family)
MTRTYTAKRLLEHGPLTFAEFMEITGWRIRIAVSALRRLISWGLVVIKNLGGRRRHYALAECE